MRRYTVSIEPRGPALTALFDCALRMGGQCLLVLTQEPRAAEAAFVRALRAHLLSSDWRDEWPGTRLSGGRRGEVAQFVVSPALIEVLKQGPPSLWDWLHPEYPEDLAFLRPDGSVWFSSIHHEHDAWCDVTAGEAEIVARYWGEGALVKDAAE